MFTMKIIVAESKTNILLQHEFFSRFSTKHNTNERPNHEWWLSRRSNLISHCFLFIFSFARCVTTEWNRKCFTKMLGEWNMGRENRLWQLHNVWTQHSSWTKWGLFWRHIHGWICSFTHCVDNRTDNISEIQVFMNKAINF